MSYVPRRNDQEARIQALERRIAEIERTSRLGSASIGEGGLTVRGGGEIRIADGGNIVISGGGGLSIADGGGISLDGGDIAIHSGDLVVDQSGGILVKDGGNITVTDGGDIIVSGTGEVRSSDFAANTTGWRIANGSAEFNTITLRNGIIGVDALNRRTEAQTFSGSRVVSSANQADLNVTVVVPSWAQTWSILANGVADAAAVTDTRISGTVSIEGNAGVTSTGAVYIASTSLPASHARTGTAAGNVVVNLHTGCAPTSATAVWGLSLTVLAVFVKSS